MNKQMQCQRCCDLLPDYEWLDVDGRKMVDRHTEECQLCSEKKEMITGKFQESTGGIVMIDKIDFADEIMKAVSREQKPAANPFLFRLLGVLVALEIAVVFFSGFTGFQDGLGVVDQLLQLISEVTFPFLDESLGLFEISDYLSIPTEFLPGNFMAVLFITGVFIAGALFLISRKRSTYYGS